MTQKSPKGVVRPAPCTVQQAPPPPISDHQRNFFLNSPHPYCSHLKAEPITTVDGEHVGYLCPDCDAALDWKEAGDD